MTTALELLTADEVRQVVSSELDERLSPLLRTVLERLDQVSTRSDEDRLIGPAELGRLLGGRDVRSIRRDRLSGAIPEPCCRIGKGQSPRWWLSKVREWIDAGAPVREVGA